jgi:hypothetical protein
VAALGHEDVGRFDVAMDDAGSMSRVQRVRDVDAERQDDLNLQWTPCDPVLQRQSVQKLHGDEGLAVLVVNFVDGADVRMIQCRSSLGFALKAGEGLRIFGYVVGQELEGNKAVELDVLSFVHHTHAAAAEFLDDAVVRDSLADHGATPCYAGREGKSMRANEFAAFKKVSCRKIAIALIDLPPCIDFEECYCAGLASTGFSNSLGSMVGL